MNAATQTAMPEMTLVDVEERPAHPLAQIEGMTPVAGRPGGGVTITTLLQMAVEKGDLERAERFWQFALQVKAEAAREAFVRDMVTFKLNAPDIHKLKQAKFGTTQGRQAEGASYSYADHAEVVLKVTKKLAECGFTHDWEVAQPGGGFVHVTCVLTHRLGHSKRVTIYASPDTSGGKNGIQSIGSVTSYLERYTLLAVTGLTTQEKSAGDNDGHTLPAANDERRTDPPFDADPPAGASAAQQHDEPGCYTAEEFDANLADWKDRIQNRGKEPDRLMSFISSRSGLGFTEAQKKILRAVRPA